MTDFDGKEVKEALEEETPRRMAVDAIHAHTAQREQEEHSLTCHVFRTLILSLAAWPRVAGRH